MKTWRFFIYGILEEIRKAHDDSDIHLAHILYVTLLSANRLIFERLRGQLTGKYLQTFKITNVQQGDRYKYFTLPADIFDLDNDGAIDFVRGEILDDGWHLPVSFVRTKPGRLSHLYLSTSTAPSSENSYWYLVGSEVRLVGIDCQDLELMVGLYSPVTVTVDCTTNVDAFSLDEEIPVAADQLEQLKFRVMQSLRFGLLIPSDKRNDGSDSVIANIHQSQHEGEKQEQSEQQ